MKVAFLIGAGCEGKGQVTLPSGETFKRDTIVAKDAVDLIKKINKESNLYKVSRGGFLSYNSTSVLYQTLVELGVSEFSFSPHDSIIVKRYLQYKGNGKDDKGKPYSDVEKDKIRRDFQNFYKTKFYDVINNEGSSLSENVIKFLNNACFYEAVDSLFNCLRKPSKYPSETGRVMKLYFAAFISVCRRIIGESEWTTFLSTPMGINDARNKLIELIRLGENRIIDKCKDTTGLYYNTINSLITRHPDYETMVVTTNYTGFAESIIGLPVEKVAYIHGRLNLFEDVKTKKVANISSFSDDEVIFPHIFIQSGIKPVVSSNQITELCKATEAILHSDNLIIIGYGVNSDDEHISNLLRERLQNGKRISCFLYGTGPMDDQKERIKQELFDSTNIDFYNTTSFSSYISSL